MPDDIPGLRKRGWIDHLLAALASTLPIVALGVIISVVTPGPKETTENNVSSAPEPPSGSAEGSSDTGALPKGNPPFAEHMLPFGAPPALATTVLRSVAIRSVVAHPGANNDFAYGSGATIRNGVILTAAHVISEGAVETSVSCATAEGFRTVPARTVILDRLRDVGFLEASDCTAPEMRISTAPVRRTEPLITVGFHFGSDGRGNMAAVQEVFPTSLVPLVTLGEHRDESNDQEDAPEAQRSMSEEHKKMVDECRKKGIPLPFAVSGALIPGKSGSPVVSVDGSLVGMVVMTAMSHNRSFIVPTANILHVMRQAGL